MRILGIIIIVLVLGFFGGYGIMHSQIDNNRGREANNVIPMDAKAEQHWKDSSSEILTKKQAEAIAIEDANIKEKDIYGLHTKKENYYGIDIYDVEFFVDQKEYNYNIDVNTGEILAMEYEVDKKDYINLMGNPVDEQMAKELVKQQIPGVTDRDINIRREQENDFWQYEVFVEYKGINYEISIDKNTGTFVEWKWEKHHR